MSKPIINLPGERKRDSVLKNLEPGDVFMHRGSLYMKIPEVMCYDTHYDYCVLSLESGVFISMDACETVIPVKVTMDVEYE